jgi:iron-sulfur cluster insertion protein
MGQCTRYAASENTPLKAVIFTENAASKVGELLAEMEEEEKDVELNLRVYVEGGGCAGLQYGFKFDEKHEDDHTEVTKGITLLIDPQSHEALQGSTIDYKEDLEGANFTIDNPNAKKTCGCGVSFDLNDPIQEN